MSDVTEESKYYMPYIEDKKLYMAICFACKIVRESKTINNAIKISSSYYGVDAKEVEKYLRIRIAHGKKIANENKKKTSYFVVVTEDFSSFAYSVEIKKSTSEKSVIKKAWRTIDDTYGDCYAESFTVNVTRFEKEFEAEKFAEEERKRLKERKNK